MIIYMKPARKYCSELLSWTSLNQRQSHRLNPPQAPPQDPQNGSPEGIPNSASNLSGFYKVVALFLKHRFKFENPLADLRAPGFNLLPSVWLSRCGGAFKCQHADSPASSHLHAVPLIWEELYICFKTLFKPLTSLGLIIMVLGI